DAQRDEVVARRGGAALAEAEVILAGAPLVAMALDRRRDLRILLQPPGPALHGVAGVGLQLVLVEIEEDAVADAGDEVGLGSWRGAGGGRRGGRRGARLRAALSARGSRLFLRGLAGCGQRHDRGETETLQSHALEIHFQRGSL